MKVALTSCFLLSLILFSAFAAYSKDSSPDTYTKAEIEKIFAGYDQVLTLMINDIEELKKHVEK